MGSARRNTLVAAVALCLLACAFAPTASARVTKAIWGPVEMPDGSSAFRLYKDLGVDVFQIQLQWNRVAGRRPRNATNPRDRAYDWPSTVDSAVRAGSRRGIEVALLVKGSPTWANGGRAPEWAPSNKAYANF